MFIGPEEGHLTNLLEFAEQNRALFEKWLAEWGYTNTPEQAQQCFAGTRRMIKWYGGLFNVQRPNRERQNSKS